MSSDDRPANRPGETSGAGVGGGDGASRNSNPTRRGEAAASPVGELGYVEATAELDAIIAELDRGVIDVDVLEERLCRAVEIVEELDRRIRGARERVNSILPRLDIAARQDDNSRSDRG